ncbi:hypothetical protein KO361_03105 [Candidatus Woesearchaeota archaeon]|nr:hypothetical protein [Candidatus Woesearchaeota archaeon]
MYSDDWLAQRYSSDKKIQVSELVFYRIWHDNAGTEIGATVDFELANDFHYELLISEWRRVLTNILGVSEPGEVTAKFSDYFEKHKGVFDFESSLIIHGIVFQKIAYY